MTVGNIKVSGAAMAQGRRARSPRRDACSARVEFARAAVLAGARGVALVEPSASPVETPILSRTGQAAPPPERTVTRPERRRLAPAPRPRAWRASAGRRALAAFLGASLVGGGAYAATNWIVGLNGGSSGLGQSATVQNLTVSAVASPAAANQLYPGGTGDVVLTISNPNPFPVTVTGVNLPTNTTYANGYTTSALTSQQTGCISTSPSYVIWNYSSASTGSAHTLTSPVTVGPSGNANNPLTVTLTNDASMTAAAPAACENTYFSMPSLTGVTASGGSGSVTSTPVVDGWTS